MPLGVVDSATLESLVSSLSTIEKINALFSEIADTNNKMIKKKTILRNAAMKLAQNTCLSLLLRSGNSIQFDTDYQFQFEFQSNSAFRS